MSARYCQSHPYAPDPKRGGCAGAAGEGCEHYRDCHPPESVFTLARLASERAKAEQVAARGAPATRWWAARFLEALDLLEEAK